MLCSKHQIAALNYSLVTVDNELKLKDKFSSIKLKDEDAEIVCETGSDKVTIALLTFEQHSTEIGKTALQTQVELQCKQLHLNHVLLERKRYIKGPPHMSPVNRAGSVSKISPRHFFPRKNLSR